MSNHVCQERVAGYVEWYSKSLRGERGRERERERGRERKGGRKREREREETRVYTGK